MDESKLLSENEIQSLQRSLSQVREEKITRFTWPDDLMASLEEYWAKDILPSEKRWAVDYRIVQEGTAEPPSGPPEGPVDAADNPSNGASGISTGYRSMPSPPFFRFRFHSIV